MSYLYTITTIGPEVHDHAHFYKKWHAFMNDTVKPGFMGLSTIEFRCYLSSAEDHEVMVHALKSESNRMPNQDSRCYLLALTKGFIGGYLANQAAREGKQEGDSDVPF